jgi:hypothetical protein
MEIELKRTNDTRRDWYFVINGNRTSIPREKRIDALLDLGEALSRLNYSTEQIAHLTEALQTYGKGTL